VQCSSLVVSSSSLVERALHSLLEMAERFSSVDRRSRLTVDLAAGRGMRAHAGGHADGRAMRAAILTHADEPLDDWLARPADMTPIENAWALTEHRLWTGYAWHEACDRSRTRCVRRERR
jgi:hypothetical protein